MDVHTGEMAREAWDFFFRFLAEAEALGEPVIIEGGWAVAAHGSPIASIDLDIIISGPGSHDFYDLLHGEGRYAGMPGAFLLDWSELDGKNSAWASNAGYVRGELLDGNTTDVRVQAPGGFWRNGTFLVHRVHPGNCELQHRTGQADTGSKVKA